MPFGLRNSKKRGKLHHPISGLVGGDDIGLVAILPVWLSVSLKRTR